MQLLLGLLLCVGATWAADQSSGFSVKLIPNADSSSYISGIALDPAGNIVVV